MKQKLWRILGVVALVTMVMLVVPTSNINAEAAHIVVEEGHFRLVSHSSSGEPGNGKSTESVISSDGNVVAFNSEATNLVSGDVNDETDIFVVDLSDETIELVSVDSSGVQGNGESFWPQISSTGRWVAFNSFATNFVENDTNGKFDIFLYDRNTDELVCITMGIDGAVANEFSILYDISANDQYVVFASLASNLITGDTEDSWDLFAYDLTTETVIRIAPYRAGLARSSSDGRYIAFKSNDQIDIADTNTHDDIYLYDRNTSETVLVSKSSEGIVGNNDSSLGDISDDGKWILFESYADNLIDGDVNEHCDMFRYEVETGELSMLTSPITEVDDRGFNDGNALSSDGQQSIYNHGSMGIFWDLQNSGSVWFSFSFETYIGSISGDGQRITFTDYGSVLNSLGRLGGQIYLLDLNNRELESPWTLSHEDLDDNQSPDAFHWKGVAGADEYTVEIKDNITNAVITKQTVLVDDVCSDFLCTFSYPTALPIGEYKWHVVARNETGEGEWSSYDLFEATPAATRLRSPGVDAAVYGGRPTFKWYFDADATSYMIEFYDPSDALIGEWQKNPECDEVTFCEYRIPNTMDLGSNYGDYDWRVHTISNGIAGPWSEMRTFTYTALERTYQISPADGFTTASTTPTFEWAEITGATMYLFQLRLPDDSLVRNYLVSDATYCTDGGTCVWTIDDGVLDPGTTYKWHVRAKNGRNFGRWTAYRTITITE